MKIKLAILSAVALTMAACSNEVNFGEQYKKTVYIVGSDNMLYTAEHYYGVSDNSMLISVYCASSEPVKEPFTVKLRVDPTALDEMNAKFELADPLYVPKVLLPEDCYLLPSDLSVTIQAGTQYANVHIPLLTDALDPDVHYALPVSIVSNDAGYDINPDMKSIVYEVKMLNGFSGTFSGSSAESETVIRSVQPTLTALSAFSVRMPIHNIDAQNLNTDFMRLVIAPDSVHVSIFPWEFAPVEDLGGSTYNTATQRFELNYRYTDSKGVVYNITEKIRNINAPEETEY
jgi:hypothetical protein